jgi:DNA-binding LacI/PurR family transcriptional regulator
MVKIEDVAREAGVSVATVSRVLNDLGGALPETQEKVREAVKRLHYEPNLSARNLRKNESRIILILAPNFSNPYYSNVLSGICDVSRNLGYSTLIYNTYDSNALDEKLVTSLFQKNRADGMITLAVNRMISGLPKPPESIRSCNARNMWRMRQFRIFRSITVFRAGIGAAPDFAWA